MPGFSQSVRRGCSLVRGRRFPRERESAAAPPHHAEGMTHTTHEPSAAPAPPRTVRPPLGLGAITGVVSGLVAAAAGSWLARPETYPDHLRPDSGSGSLFELVEPTVGASLLLALGLAGVLLSIVVSRVAGGSRLACAAAAAVGGVHLLLFTDLTLLVTFGYAVAILGPPALILYVAAAAVRSPRLRWVLAALVAAGAAVALTLGVDAAAVEDFWRGLGSGLRRAGVGMILNLVAFTGGMAWVVLALRVSGLRWWGDRPASTTYVAPRRDWGWWITLLAALGPLPYAAVRMTWLTPWPAFAGGGDLDADPAIRVFGVCLGFAALGGSVLTLGLLARWGTTYPGWVPGVGGRAVSPGWPTLTAIGVGLAITVAGRAMVQMILTEEDTEVPVVEVLLILPFPVWGPLLVAAAVAYHQRRHPARDAAPEAVPASVRA